MYSDNDLFVNTEQGVLMPKVPVGHRDDEYDPSGFDTLQEMQSRHFWYTGRHRFLLFAARASVSYIRHGANGFIAWN